MQMFSEIGTPPDVITRWGSWLRAALYYGRNLPEVIKIVDTFEDDGKIVENVKKAIKSQELGQELLKIQSQYKCLLDLLDGCESKVYSFKKAYDDLGKIDC